MLSLHDLIEIQSALLQCPVDQVLTLLSYLSSCALISSKCIRIKSAIVC